MYMIIYILFEYDFKPVGYRLTAPESDTWVMMAIVKPDTIPTAHAFLTKSFETIGFVFKRILHAHVFLCLSWILSLLDLHLSYRHVLAATLKYAFLYTIVHC